MSLFILTIVARKNERLCGAIAEHSKMVMNFFDAVNLIDNIFGHVLHPAIKNFAADRDFAVIDLNFHQAGIYQRMASETFANLVMNSFIGSLVSLRALSVMLPAILLQ